MGVHLYTNGAWTDSGKIYRNSLNLLDDSSSSSTYGNVTLSFSYNKLFLVGECNSTGLIKNPLQRVLLPAGIYTISTQNNGGEILPTSQTFLQGFDDNAVRIFEQLGQNGSRTFTLLEDTYVSIRIIVYEDFEYNCSFNIMLNKGNEILPYERFNRIDWYGNNGHNYSSGAWD